MSDEIERLLSEVSRRPDDSELLQSLAKAYLERCEYTAARSTLARAITLNPRDPWNHLYAGNATMSLDDHEGALVHFKEAQRLAPRLDIVWVCLADCHGALGNLVTAESCYRTAVDMDPESEMALRNLALFQTWKRSNS